jgi:hypothetical protein
MGNYHSKAVSGSKGWTLIKIHDFCKDEAAVLRYFVANGMIPREKECPSCYSPMKLADNRWRCYSTVKTKKGKIRCNTTISVRDHTWFSRVRLPVGTVMEMTYMLLMNFELRIVAHELCVNKCTLTHWIGFVRDVSSSPMRFSQVG